jgi:hypothetical protein
MKALNTNHMKFVKGIFFAVFIAFVAFGCEKEVIRPESDNNIQASSFHFINRPPLQCGPSVFSSMKDGAQNLGSIEILNNSSELYLIFNMNQFKFIEELKVYTGDASNMPIDGDGNLSLENFGFQQVLTSAANDYTLVLPLSSMASCADLVVWARVSTKNMFGQTTATNYTWMTGASIANGYMMNYCATTCLSGNSTVSSTI